jgi:hypothetical protein
MDLIGRTRVAAGPGHRGHPGRAGTQAVLIPGGVLLSDGTTTWFGEAVTK